MKKYILPVIFQSQYAAHMLANTVASIATVGANLLGPFFLVKSFIEISDDDDGIQYQKAAVALGVYGAAYACGKVLPAIRRGLLSPIKTAVSHDLTYRVLEHYYHLPMEYRTDHTASPEVQHFSNSYEHIGENLVIVVWGEMLPIMLEILAAMALLVVLEPESGAIVIGLAVSYLISAYIGSKYVGDAQNKQNQAAFAAFEALLKRLDRYESAHNCTNVRYEMKKLDQGLTPFDKATQHAVFVRETVTGSQSFIISIGFIGIILLNLRSIEKGTYDTNDLLWVLLYLSQFCLSLDQFAKSANKMSESYSNLKELGQYLEQKHEFSDDPSKPGLKIEEKNANIKFDGVTLRYKDKESSALQDINFEVKAGKTVAIVGESGSGKSSIMHLLCGFYNPTQGQILLNQQNITQLNRESIREVLAIIPQSPVLLNASIEENVHYGNFKASKERVSTAIREAQLGGLAQQYGDNNSIGENGKKVSGGQRQRIAIARALLRKHMGASIIVADEPTSALDSDTASAVMKEIYKISKNTTTMIITHQISTLSSEHVDQVIVLEGGKIIEQGSMQELLKNKESAFYKLYQSAPRPSPKKASEFKQEEGDDSPISLAAATHTFERFIPVDAQDDITQPLLKKDLQENSDYLTLN